MNENKFLNRLNQGGSQLPAVAAPPVAVLPAAPRQEAVADEYDPIQRLLQQLTRQTEVLVDLKDRVKTLEDRPQAATQAELQSLLTAARKGINFKLDDTAIAKLLLPALTQGMPDAASMKAAADAGAGTITAAGTSSAQRISEAGTIAAQLIGEAGTTAASRIQVASDAKTHSFLGRVWFKSWREAGIVLSVLLVLVGSIAGVIIWQQRAVLNAQQETKGVREFTDWVKAQPEGKKLYDRYYNR